jgi:hypothetical protein
MLAVYCQLCSGKSLYYSSLSDGRASPAGDGRRVMILVRTAPLPRTHPVVGMDIAEHAAASRGGPHAGPLSQLGIRHRTGR